MKKVYRYEDNKDYWDRRWAEAGADSQQFDNLDIYPIKYAEKVMEKGKSAIEVGCGPGRVLKHYANLGYDICGVERSEVAVSNVKAESNNYDIRVGDVLDLPYADASFDILMAFGLFHNLENGLEQALRETRRIMRDGGKFCISMRPNNVEMNLNEIYWNFKYKGPKSGSKFHKILVNEKEFSAILGSCGMKTEKIYRSRNLPFLYRIPLLRMRSETEAERRSKGYRLNAFGRFLDKILVSLFPYHTANVIIFVGRAY